MKYYNKEWYYNGCVPMDRNEDDYIEYVDKCLPKWYGEFSIHDDQIRQISNINNILLFDLNADDYKHTKYQLKFYNPQIIEDCRLENSWCISDELYICNGFCEYHLMVMDFNDNSLLEYFTVKCSNMELIIGENIYKVFL